MMAFFIFMIWNKSLYSNYQYLFLPNNKMKPLKKS